MLSQQTKTLKLMYSGKLEYISCPKDIKYEDLIEIAIERFTIPIEFRNFMQISNESRYIFNKETFEYFILLFPNPELIFYIRIDYYGLLGNLRTETTRKPFATLRNKRKHNDVDYKTEGVPVTRQNCFMGSLPGSDWSSEEEESNAKRPRNDFSKVRAIAVKKKSRSKRSIRI